jgi:tetratricopeptide (TPR) repeat protein
LRRPGHEQIFDIQHSMKPAPPLAASGPKPKSSRFDGFWLAVLIVLAGAAAYANSFSGPFIFDDVPSVTDNQSIRHLTTAFWPDHGDGQTVEGRPVLNLSLALNYAFGHTQVRGYHLANVLIHLLAGLTLFGLVRRTLRLPSLSQRFGHDASLLAGLIALLWTVHPLQTESVTYVIQRAESLMGLFFLFTFYAFVRSLDSARPGLWRALCVVSFFLGIGTKEVIVAVPPLLLLYDGVFVSGSLAKAWRAHRGTFLALASGLIFLATLIVSSGGNRSGTIGLGVGVSPLAHALTQPLALLTYLKLSVLPYPLILDYGTILTRRDWELLPQASAIFVLIALTVVALKRSPALGFIGAWFFVILAPTSLAPEATQIIVEHRMYLPLAAVVVLIVLGLYRLLGRRSFPVLLALAVVFGWLTSQRNETYRTEEQIWGDAVAKCPANERAHYSLGAALARVGRIAAAATEYEEALRLRPDYPEAHSNLAGALFAEGRTAEAIAQCEEALRLKPDYAEAHNNLGDVLFAEGRTAGAIAQYEEAVRLKPNNAEAHDNLGIALKAEGRTAEAIAQCEEAVRLQPDLAEAHNNLGYALNAGGRTDGAIAQYEEALRLKPDYAEAHNNLGIVLSAEGRTAEAVAQDEEAVRLKPDYAEAHNNLGSDLSAEGRIAEAIAQYEEAVRLKPDLAEAHNNLGGALKAAGRTAEAIAQYEEAVRLKPDYAEARNNLGNTLSAEGRSAEAITQYEEAVRLQPDIAPIHFNLALALLKIPGRTNEAVMHLKEVLRLQPDNDLARKILASIAASGP